MSAVSTFFVIFIVMNMVAEGAYRLGLRSERVGVDAPSVDVIKGALLTLLALLLAFGVSMAESRYDSRIRILVREGETIGTVDLRADLADAAIKDRLKSGLKEYLTRRIDFYRAPDDADELLDLERATTATEDRIWQLVVRQVTENPGASANLLIANSVSEMLDARTEQNSAFRLFLPKSVVYLLFFSSALVIGLVTYGFGARGIRHLIFMELLALVISAALFVVTDLDRPRGGLIQVPAAPLERLQQRIIETERLNASRAGH